LQIQKATQTKHVSTSNFLDVEVVVVSNVESELGFLFAAIKGSTCGLDKNKSPLISSCLPQINHYDSPFFLHLTMLGQPCFVVCSFVFSSKILCPLLIILVQFSNNIFEKWRKKIVGTKNMILCDDEWIQDFPFKNHILNGSILKWKKKNEKMNIKKILVFQKNHFHVTLTNFVMIDIIIILMMYTITPSPYNHYHLNLIISSLILSASTILLSHYCLFLLDGFTLRFQQIRMRFEFERCLKVKKLFYYLKIPYLNTLKLYFK